MRITFEGEVLVLARSLPTVQLALAQVLTAKNEFDYAFSDFTEATFAGYARSANIVWPAPTVNGQGYGETNCPQVVFTAGAGIAAQTIYWALLITVDGAAVPRVLAAHKFNPAKVMNTQGQQIKIDIKSLSSIFVP